MYESHFGFSAKPFQLNPDPDFFFGSRGHKRAMAYLEYGLHQGEGFIVITGEVGAGKTTLLRGLLRRIPADTIVPIQIVSTQVDSDDLLRLVATAFGLPAGGEDKATLLTRLQQHLESIFSSVVAKIFPDHYDFSVADVLRLKQEFLKLKQKHPQAVLITTRKDAMRLQQAELKLHLEDLPFFVIDIAPGFIGQQEELFLSKINSFLAGH